MQYTEGKKTSPSQGQDMSKRKTRSQYTKSKKKKKSNATLHGEITNTNRIIIPLRIEIIKR